MAEEFNFELNLEVRRLIEGLESIVKSGGDADKILNQLKVTLQGIQKGTLKADKIFEFADVIRDAIVFRDNVDRIKERIKELGAVSQQSLGDVIASFKQLQKESDPAEFSSEEVNQAAKELNADLRQLTQSLAEYRAAQEESSRTSVTSFVESSTAALQLRTNIDEVKNRIRELRDASNDSLAVVVEAFKQSNKEFSGFEISQAVNEIKQFEASLFTLRGGFDESVASIVQFRSNVDEISTRIQALVQTTGRPLDDVIQGFRNLNDVTKEFSSAELSKAFSEVREVRFENLRELFIQLQQGGRTLNQLQAQFGNLSNVLKGFTPKEIQAVVEEVRKLGLEAPRSLSETRLKIDEIKATLVALQQTSGESLPVVAQHFRDMNRASQEFRSADINQAVRELSNETKNADSSMKQFGGTMEQVNSISTFFFGTTLASLATGVLRRLVAELDEVIDRGVEFGRTQFTLATSIRALQRLGLDVTFEEFSEQIDRLDKQFAFFTKRQISEGIAQISLLTRNLELSKQEIFDLSEATAALAIITGKDFGEEGLLVARAIASGYTEALQRAGIEASRAKIEQEALALGIDKAFLAMTQQERAAVTLRLVLDQVGNISDDVGQFQETFAGSVETSRASIENLQDELSKKFLPFWAAFLKAVVGGLEFFAKAFEFAFEVSKTATATLIGSLIGVAAAIKAFTDGVAINFENFSMIIGESILQTKQAIDDVFADDALFEDLPADQFGSFANNVAENLDDETESLKDKIRDILFRFQNDIRDAFIDLQRDLADIETDAARERADQELDLVQDIEKLNRQTNDKIADAQKKFREKELQDERKFQEDLRKLRESFLFDLEDALIERDAKQVLRLIRQFNLRKNQLERQKNAEDQARKDAFQNELQDIEVQRQRRLRELNIEHEQRMAAIEENRLREIADANLAYTRELEDLHRHLNDRLSLLREGLSAELKTWFDFYVGLLSIHSQFAAVNRPRVTRGGSQPEFQYSGAPKTISKPGGFAQGGTLVAKKPTLAVFGEVPEMVTFTPLFRQGANDGKLFGSPMPGGMGMNGRVLIEMLLSPDLVANIKDETLGEMADIIIRKV